MRNTRAVIHLENLRHNIKEIRKLISPRTKMCIPVKADAYGHGLIKCAQTSVESGADYLAIATVDEGIELRQNGIKVPLLLLSLCDPSEVAFAVKYDITPFVFDKEYIGLFSESCSKLNKKNYPVHIAVDTGMGRIGCLPQDAGKIATTITSTGNLVLGGMGTHFAVSDSIAENDQKFTHDQYFAFMEAIDSVRSMGIDPGLCHASSSAATVNDPLCHLDMVRPGIIVYGYYPDQITKEYLESKNIPLDLKPVMTLETKVSAVRPFTEGKTIGYGRTYKTTKETYVGVLPLGYADGMLRSWSGIKVSIKGKEYPVCGRICMDQCMINLGLENDVERWDTAIIFGSQEDGACNTAQDIADYIGTISYEVTTGIGKRVPRVFTDIPL